MSDPIEISDYLLGELDGEQTAEAERRLREDPRFRAEVERLRPTVTRLERLPSQAWENPEPPPLALPPEAERRNRTPAPSWWQRLAPRPALALGATAALAVGIGIGLLLGGSDPGGDPETGGQLVTLEPVGGRGEGATGSAQLVERGDGNDREAIVDVSGVAPSAPGEFYELWLLSARDDLVSLGAFRVGESGQAMVRVPVPVDPSQYAFLDLSLESDNGDASHSGRSLLRAPT